MNINEMEWPLSKEELKFLYWKEEKTTYEIGDIFNKTKSSISYWMRKYKIRHRSTNVKKTQKEFENEIYDLVKQEYSILGKYKNVSTKIKIKHNKCNNVYKVRPDLFLDGTRCPKCASNSKKTNKQFKNEVYNLVKNKYTVLGEYKGSRIKIKIKHNKCGHIYKVNPNHFLRGRRCPKCARTNFSKGEKRIKKFLKNNKINYKWQYNFKGCRNKQILPFDFKIKNKQIVIEYNGRQHYEPVEIFGGEKQFKQQQRNDKIKKDYCQANNIKLITIPYWEKDNIEEILKEELQEVM